MLQIAELCMQIFLEFKEATIHDPQYNERIFNSEYIRAVQKVLQILFKTIAKSYPNQASNISQVGIGKSLCIKAYRNYGIL